MHFGSSLSIILIDTLPIGAPMVRLSLSNERIFNLILRQFVFHLVKVAQVAEGIVNSSLRMWYMLYSTFKLTHYFFQFAGSLRQS